MRKFLFLFHVCSLFASLEELNLQVKNDLRLTNYPPCQILRDSRWEGILDVAIIGAGMAGQTAAFALKREGIDQICLFDQASLGEEGPWLTYARMKTLISAKTQMGPAYWVPSLTYEAYHRARFGSDSWEKLFKVETHCWGEYLLWIRKVLDLPVKNGWKAVSLEPQADCFRICFENGQEVLARKVIFAMGREGVGGHRVPDFLNQLPSTCWSFANQPLSCEKLKEKRVGVIGGGASAFDAATVLANTGSKEVVLFCRRDELNRPNKQRELYLVPFYRDFYEMDEDLHWDFLTYIFDTGLILPTRETIEGYQQTAGRLELGTLVLSAKWDGEVILETNRGTYHLDHLVNATGYCLDLHDSPLIAPFAHSILTWGDRKKEGDPRLTPFPYLGPHYEFQGSKSFLKDLYCFNYAAFMSHGTASHDMPGISFGAQRMARGIAADLFLQEIRQTYETWKNSSLWQP